MRTKEDLSGKKFGRLTVVKYYGRYKIRQRLWLCICDCGNEVIVRTGYLNSGMTKSCGCLKIDLSKKRMTTHGMSHVIPEYGIWVGIKTRCSDLSNKDYGGRGISVCERWLHSFENFFADMGSRPSEKHSIERRENDEGYSPSNCYWGTRKIQAGNRRSNKWVEHGDGRKMILQDWANLLQIDYRNLNWHLKRRTLKETIDFYKRKGKIKE